MQFLRANTQVKVVIGPVVAVGDGFTPVTTLALNTADEAELLKHDAASVTDISAATFAAITSADGYYNLTLTTSHTDTEGLLTVLINDDSLCLPVKKDFMVLAEAAYDSLFVAKDDGFMDVNIKTIGRADTQETEASNLETACANYSATRGLSGTALPAAAADAAGGLPISDAGGLDLDTQLGKLVGTIASGTHNPQSGDSYAIVNSGTHGNAALKTLIDAVGGYVDTEVAAIVSELAKVPKSDSNVTWNATALASIQSECNDALVAYDPPTKAELDIAVANVSVEEIQATAIADLFNTDSGTTYASAVAGSAVKEIADNAGGASLTVQDIVDGVWDEPIASHVGAGTTGEALDDAGAAGTPPTAGEIADAVWDEARSDHTTNGTFGQRVLAQLDDGVTHGGTSALLRLGSSTSTPALYVTSSGGNVVRFQATGGNGTALKLDADGTGHGLAAVGGASNGDGFNLGGGGGGPAGAGAAINGGLLGNVTGNVSGSVGSVTGNVGGNVAGSVGSVTGNVGGNVTGSIGSLATQAKADVNAEVDTALTDYDGPTNAEMEARTLVAASYATAANQVTIAGYLDTEIAAILADVTAIKAKTDQLTFTTANRVDATAITVSDKTGYALSATGLDLVVPADPSAIPALGTASVVTWIGYFGAWTVNEVRSDSDSVDLRNSANNANLASHATSDSGSQFVSGEPA